MGFESSTNQAINVLIKRKTDFDWIFTALYASPDPLNREELWDYLAQMSYLVNQPWLVAGVRLVVSYIRRRFLLGDGIPLLYMNMIPPLETDSTIAILLERERREEQEHRLFCSNLPLRLCRLLPS